MNIEFVEREDVRVPITVIKKGDLFKIQVRKQDKAMACIYMVVSIPGRYQDPEANTITAIQLTTGDCVEFIPSTLVEPLNGKLQVESD